MTPLKGEEAFRTPESVERSLALFRLGDQEEDPYVLERELLRVPPNVMFERGLGAADVLRMAGVTEEVGVGVEPSVRGVSGEVHGQSTV